MNVAFTLLEDGDDIWDFGYANTASHGNRLAIRAMPASPRKLTGKQQSPTWAGQAPV